MNLTPEDLKENRKNITALYTELVVIENELLKKGKENVFFLEGNDDIKYYYPRFESANLEYYPFSSGGKENVIDARKYINNMYKGKLKIKFFIDKDFDDLKTEGNLFVTPCYSIENLYISDKCFKKIIICEFCISEFSDEEKEDFKKICNLYKNRKKEFLDCLDELMFWFYFHSSKEECDLSKFKDKLFSRKSPLIKFSLNKIEKNYSFEILKKLTVNPLEYNQDDIDKFDKIVPTNEREYFYRGKYLMEFFEKFIKSLIQEINQTNSTFLKNKKKIKFKLPENNVLSFLVQYSETPESLEEFLRN